MSPSVLWLSATFLTKSLSRLETGERGATPKIDDSMATLLNAEIPLFWDAVSIEIVPVALGSKDILVGINLDESRTFAKPVRDGDKDDGGRVFLGGSDSKTAKSSEFVCMRSQRFCA